MAKVKRRTWKDMGAAEKAALVSLWVLIAGALYWVVVATSPRPQPEAESKLEPVKAVSTYTSASEQALLSATKHVEDLDTAMLDSIAVLKSGQLKEIGAQSRRFNTLVDSGKTQFGDSVFEPLGQCFSAGIYASLWWQSQRAAAMNAGVEKIPGSIQDALKSYKTARDACLVSATPAA
ncbi:hypothetical protein [Pseudomonas sp. PH1b]|uniref:hypothetical protein n=1 Tax=Pseudomonas sp. PH1b TaxID=1397282 RepID=UPI0012FF0A1F|nr:hypothetical protein [Pseudomonas sp. PH1b]